jgi:hypothetical protein
MSEAETQACAIAWAAPSEADSASLEDVLWAVEEEERRLHDRIEKTAKAPRSAPAPAPARLPRTRHVCLPCTLAQVMSLMEKREETLTQRAEMRANANDPNRLAGRSREAAKALMHEAQLRVRTPPPSPPTSTPSLRTMKEGACTV